MTDDKEAGVDQQFERERPGLLTELARATKNGMGMFLEAYFVFAIGEMTTIWADTYPSCASNADCTNAENSITYMEVVGIICSQVMLGFIGDHIGRLLGARFTVTLMLVGGILLTVSFGAGGSIAGQMIMFTISVFIFDLGVGGEYPMAASFAAERSESEHLPRGRTIAFVFAHQGWGTWANAAVLCFLLAVTNTGGCESSIVSAGTAQGVLTNSTEYLEYTTLCNVPKLQAVWRLSYAFGVLIVIILFIYRWCLLTESAVWSARQETYGNLSKEELHQQRIKNTKLLFSRKYIVRLFGAGFAWYINDISFYGNKLFQGTIINNIIGGGSGSYVSLQATLNYSLLNASVGLAGYYFAAFFVDYPWMGRVRMQTMGFICIGILFLACGLAYNTLTAKNAGMIPWFEFMYLMSSFFQQFGPNVTTWMMPVELFPTDVRAQAQGYCAAFGKLGALTSTLLFTYGVNNKTEPATVFIINGALAFLGAIVTVALIPEPGTNATLRAMDRKWSIDRHGGSVATIDSDAKPTDLQVKEEPQ